MADYDEVIDSDFSDLDDPTSCDVGVGIDSVTGTEFSQASAGCFTPTDIGVDSPTV